MAIYYPDISHHHPVKQWDRLEPNVGFIISKATQGTSFVDSYLKTFVAECEKRHIPYWLYTYLNKGNELAQAKFMVKTCENIVGDWFCGYILDVEEDNSEANCIEALEWLQTQCTKTMVYIGWSDKDNYKKLINNRGGNCAWWEARYGKNDGTYNSKYPCHSGVDLHQFTENGKCPGFPETIDLNRLTGRKDISFFTTPLSKKQTISTATPAVEANVGPNRTATHTGEITASYLNIRKEPDKYADKLKSYPVLPGGTIVDICDEYNINGDIWYFIKYNGKYGYASGKYIKIVD